MAPGRLEILGNHTDYNEGLALSCAIDMPVYAAASPAPDNATFELVSARFPGVIRIGDEERKTGQDWARYPLGVYSLLKQGGYPVVPFRLAIHSDLPAGCGLSSSAALEAATAMCLCTMAGARIGKIDMAKICQRAENDFAGADCGMLDQISVILGEKDKLLFTDFRTLSTRTISFPSSELCLAVVVSGRFRSLNGGEYNLKRRQCTTAAEYFARQDPEVKTLRDVNMAMLTNGATVPDPRIISLSRHIIGENERASAAGEMIEKGDYAAFGRLLNKSHESSRFNFENSSEELDSIVEAARSVNGVYGARLTGGGFGGSVLAALRPSAKDIFIETISRCVGSMSMPGSGIYFVVPSDGASEMKP
jgi:galactokinase